MKEYELWAWNTEVWRFVRYKRLTLLEAFTFAEFGYHVEEARRDSSGTMPLFPRMAATAFLRSS